MLNSFLNNLEKCSGLEYPINSQIVEILKEVSFKSLQAFSSFISFIIVVKFLPVLSFKILLR